MQEIVGTINDFIWSQALIYLCLGTGLFFSIMTRFVQVRLFKEMIRLLFANKESARGISSFQALAVSLSGRVGTGNIAGVAAAIGFGGHVMPGQLDRDIVLIVDGPDCDRIYAGIKRPARLNNLAHDRESGGCGRLEKRRARTKVNVTLVA